MSKIKRSVPNPLWTTYMYYGVTKFITPTNQIGLFLKHIKITKKYVMRI